MVKYASFVTLLACSMMLGACALFSDTSVRGAYDREQAVYNATLQQLIFLRRPCVEIGPWASNCLIDDETYTQIEPIRVAAAGYLNSAYRSIEAGADKDAAFFVNLATGSIAAISVHISESRGGAEPPGDEPTLKD